MQRSRRYRKHTRDYNVRWKATSHPHLKIREGVLHEEILKETGEGHYELVMLGMRWAGRCRMKSQIEVLTVLGTEDPGFRFSEKVLSAINEWSKISLKVTLKVLTGDPARVIVETAPNYGPIICSPGKKRKRNRLGKVTKKVLCHQFNLIV